MNIPEWVKPAAYGVVIGAIAVSIAGFSWGGWVTGGTAAKMASTSSHDKVIAALVPVCVGQSRSDDERTAKLAEIRETSAYQRRTVLMETGWATMPGSDSADRDLAQACLTALEPDLS
ncbi:hypothetical protein FMN63_02405 [Stappia sp. BW2]|jgi:alpha/beta superfamily hydrolase|uniref:hypothetical protein n=1 Tax=Stappia sp. BW2 TaxID=2592622 RepID=UPI0011DE770A|nr:hypothetical protein [Stappia sp. BW2]TYC80107.1 hypothetical protein FMN63_02405 [Stappia sp. BW2]